ncbi:hypothetical protein PENSPDRAFT_669366 [Peniophora sp. CONT]|nr:hypothetical protein PENSPDRAFT_669366 [Peniophora sp. CONT]
MSALISRRSFIPEGAAIEKHPRPTTLDIDGIRSQAELCLLVVTADFLVMLRAVALYGWAIFLEASVRILRATTRIMRYIIALPASKITFFIGIDGPVNAQFDTVLDLQDVFSFKTALLVLLALNIIGMSRFLCWVCMQHAEMQQDICRAAVNVTRTLCQGAEILGDDQRRVVAFNDRTPRRTQAPDNLWKRKIYPPTGQEARLNQGRQSRTTATAPAPRSNVPHPQAPDNIGPGSSVWVVDLVRAALKPNSSIFAMQLALHTLFALERGTALWNEVNASLASGSPSSITAAVNALSDREEEAQKQLDGDRINLAFRPNEFQVIARSFTHDDVQGNVFPACTYYIKPPSDWLPADPTSKPPELDHAPTHCVFLMPKRPYDPKEPYHLWILDESRHWTAIAPHAPHPDPRLHPRLLRLQPNDNTPNWVLPDTVRRKATLGKNKLVTVVPPPETSAPQESLPSGLAPRTRRAAQPAPVAGPSRIR